MAQTTVTCTAFPFGGTGCTAPATQERTNPNGTIDDLCDEHAAEHDAIVAEYADPR